ncbi:hypothetical protein AB6A40_009923 [Gnathostoma spinigerum]|uniref:Uncharacterized protein n=1 Tax=Gnathostoma spinigerum TaxID=75299 RepID=A0ABD6EYJ5_9BILA
MLNWSGAIVGMYLLFAVSMFIFYAMVAYVMQKTSALMFNLSILTADFYTLMFGIFFFKEKFHYFYFISFIIITLGSVIYAFHDTERLEPNEQRKLCPCCFMCCCCLGNDEDSSAQGSINMSQISSVAPTTGVTSLCNSSPTIITQCPSGCENPSTIIPQYPTTSSNMRYCPVHGFRPLTIPTHSPRTLDISRC